MADVIQDADMRMIQAGNSPGFALQALAGFGIGRDLVWQNLDGDGAIQACVFGRYTSPIPPAPMGATIS
jgi:hypothetical protein